MTDGPSAGGGPVLVTGATGFAGSHLLQRLAGGCDLVGWARSAPPDWLASAARWQSVDLLDRDRVRAAVRELRPSAIYHCAGTPHVAESFADPARPLAGNILATHHLFDALRRAGIGCRIVLPGSATVYGWSEAPLTEDSPLAPSSPYAVSKLAQEELGRRALGEDGLDVILTRPFNHTGPRQAATFLAPAVARQIALIEQGRGEPVLRVGNTAPRRDLSDVRDVVRAYQALMAAGRPGVVYNVASGRGRRVGEIVEALVSRARVAVRIETDPARMRATDPPVLVGDPSRLQQTTGWQPDVPFDRMIDDLLDYWRQAIVHAAG